MTLRELVAHGVRPRQDSDRTWPAQRSQKPRNKHKALGLATAGAFAALVLTLPAAPAGAVTATNTMATTANVVATCIDSVTPMAFGPYVGAGPVVSTTATISVTCTRATPYTIFLDAGTSAAATVTARAMTGPGADTLTYILTQDAAWTVPWGNTVGTAPASAIGSGLAQTSTIYGQIAALQQSAPGAYTDTVTATITY